MYHNCDSQILKYLIQHKLRIDSHPLLNCLYNYDIFPPYNEKDPSKSYEAMVKFFEILCEAGIGMYDSDENPLLFIYVENEEFFKYLIEKGVNIGCLYHGKNIIHRIASKGSIDLLKYMLKFQIPIDKVDNKGRTPYDLAIEKGKYEMAEYLKSLQKEKDLTDIPVKPSNLHPISFKDGENINF